MAGTINLALTQQFDSQGDPLSGGLLNFFTAGTTTPQTPFQDIALTIAHPNPIILDASGRVPMFYLADGFIKIRLTDKNGVVIIAADQLLVIGPSSGGSGGAGVDVTTVLQTGDIKSRYGTGVLDGFVRCNGLTIGQTGSSATELAGLKAQALYEYLWTFSNITLDSAVKGANATADFGALKRLILPDMRGRVIAGLDDMGATAANRLTSTYFGAATSGVNAIGNIGGGESQTLTTAQIPSHLHDVLSQHTVGGNLVLDTETQDHNHTWGQNTSTGGVNAGSIDHTHNYGSNPALGGVVGGGGAIGAGTGNPSGTVNEISTINAHTHSVSVGGTTGSKQGGSLAGSHDHKITGTTQSVGGGTAHSSVQPAMVMTVYIKL